MKTSKATTIVFIVWALVCFVLAIAVVPRSQTLIVLAYGAASAAFGLISRQIWSLHGEIEKLRRQLERAEHEENPPGA